MVPFKQYSRKLDNSSFGANCESKGRNCSGLVVRVILYSVTDSYLQMPPSLARGLRLVMTDVDGTLTSDGQHFDPAVAACVDRLQQAGISVGLVSGRDLPRLERIVSVLSTKGPLIAENGGVARLAPSGPLVDLGYSRKPALEAVKKLKASFPGAITELEDNTNRMVDVTIESNGVTVEELQRLVPGIQLLDSGYMVHLMPEGISKGGTLTSLLPKLGVSASEVAVFGDSPTDISLFEKFPNSVLVHNPRLSSSQLSEVRGCSAYRSDLPVEQGFCQVASYLVEVRQGD